MKQRKKLIVIGLLVVLITIVGTTYYQFLVKYNSLLSLGLENEVSRVAVIENRYQEVYDQRLKVLNEQIETLEKEALDYNAKYEIDKTKSKLDQVSYLEEVIKKRKEQIQPKVENGITYIDGLVIVNKKISVPSTYLPNENKEASQSYNKLVKDMQDKNFNISNKYSGYRTYAYQTEVYNENLSSIGKEKTLERVAKPGHSEHQIGLAFDMLNSLEQTLGYNNRKSDQEAVKWLKENAHKYGFIIRYPEGKEEITGYMHEPWHLRYVGDKASEIYESNKCLEEYYHFEGGDYID